MISNKDKKNIFNALLIRFALNKQYSFLFALVFALLISWLSIYLVEMNLQHDRRDLLARETNRYAMELMSQTAKSNVMGGVNLIGVVSAAIKPVARSEKAYDKAEVEEVLAAAAQEVKSDKTFIVDRNGIIVVDFTRGVKSSEGRNVSFRTYFKQAMAGKPNVFAAVGTNTGERGIYITAPIRSGRTLQSPPIGALTVKIDIETVDKLLDSWKGPALLLSPQGVVFAANNREWLFKVRQGLSEDDQLAIKRGKQFGASFDKADFEALKFDLIGKTTLVSERLHAVERASLSWNDPQGEWTLVLMTDMSRLLSGGPLLTVAISSGMLAFVIAFLFFGYLINRKERKSHELALIANERKMRRILETANEGFGVVDNNYVVVEVNEAMCQIVGRPREELLGRKINDFADEENRSILEEQIALRNRGESGSYEISVARPGGERVLCLFNVSPLFDENGVKTGAFGMCSDMTSRKLMEAELRASETKNRLILNSVGEGIFCVDMQQHVTFFNDACSLLLGYGAEEINGRDIHGLIHHSYADGTDYPAENSPILQTCISGRKQIVNGEMFWRKDGTCFQSEYSVTPISDRSGETAGAVVVFRDITERKKSEEELNRRMEELERFNRLTIGREEKMIELKHEINTLLEELGKGKKYGVGEKTI